MKNENSKPHPPPKKTTMVLVLLDCKIPQRANTGPGLQSLGFILLQPGKIQKAQRQPPKGSNMSFL